MIFHSVSLRISFLSIITIINIYERMDIVARCVTGRTYTLSVEEGGSVSALREDLSVLTGLSSDQLQLVSSSRLLRDPAPLQLSPGEEIQLLSKVFILISRN